MVSVIIPAGDSYGFDCQAECFDEYRLSSESLRNCSLLQRVLDCYNANIGSCTHWLLTHYTNLVRNELLSKNCSQPVVTTVPMATTTMTTPPPRATEPPPPPIACPTVSSQLQEVSEMANNEIVGSVPQECRLTSIDAAQCRYVHAQSHRIELIQFMVHFSLFSIFMHSHLRPIQFIGSDDRIQTCSLPGTWELFRHEDLIVEVEGRIQVQEGPQHTHLTKVIQLAT